MNIFIRSFAVLLLSTFAVFSLTFSITEDLVFAEVETGVDVGQKASPFKLLTVDGKEIELGSFAKDRVTLLVFGATWCPACRHEIPILKEYYSELKDDGLNVLGIDIKESVKKVKSLIEKMQINYPVVLDSNADIARLYKVVGIPLNIILDKNGIIVYKENRLPSKELLKGLL
ncbi:MAG: TlpA family protein disulfide reductase [Candidatus Scalindua sp.]